jgi:hypothetical protein
MKPRLSPEADLQRTVIQFLRLSARRGVMFLAIPNEGRRTIQEAARLKAMGMKPGAADLHITIDARSHWLEFKTGNRKQTPEQMAFALECFANGVPYALARDFDTAVAILRTWGALKAETQRRAA